MLDPTEINRMNLMRLTSREQLRLIGSLVTPKAMAQLVAYIRLHLSWYPIVTPDLARALFEFGRDMRAIVDGVADRTLRFPLYGDRLPVRTYLIFLSGFLGCSKEFADQLATQPIELLQQLAPRFAAERTNLHPAEAAE